MLCAMEPNDQDPTTPPAGDSAGDAPDPSERATVPATGAPDGPRRLYRSRDERVIGGVCGGLAEYFGIDPLIVRIIAVGLVFAGGAGFLAYLAAWLLVPEQDGDALTDRGTGRWATIAGTILLVLAIGTVLPFRHGPFGGWSWGGPLLSLICLGLAGLAIWWVASGEHPAASGTRDILRRAGLGVALLAVCGLLAIGGAWATAAGGGVLVAVVVIVAGLWLVAGAFLGGARWLILPALALALPAGVVSAANIDVQGGVGDREYRPAAASEVRGTYKLGAGHLMLDLRDTHLPPGDRRLKVELGAGAVSIAVPRNVCVTSAAHVGAGQVTVFDHGSGGLDVDWRDDRRAPAGTTRLIVDGDVGVGVLHVSYDDPRNEHFDKPSLADRERGNAACIGGVRG
jgi:phage shock protein PspC (stress-responsive transcriptional regulator)